MFELNSSCDFLLTNDIELSVSRPLDLCQIDKPIAYPLTLSTSATQGDTTLDVNFVPLTLPRNIEIIFNDVAVVTSRKHEIGEVILEVLPISGDIPELTNTVISQVFPVLSAFKANNNFQTNTVESRNYKSGVYNVTKNTSRKADIEIEGNYVRYDTGLYFARLASVSQRRIWFILNDTLDHLEGLAYVVNYNEVRISDAHKKVSFGLLIDGEPYISRVQEEVAAFLQDSTLDVIVDSTGSPYITSNDPTI